jgi:enoyl-CoA hydratase/carnithine racemase
VPRDRLYPEAEALARSLARRPSEALRRAKQAVLQGLDMPLDQGLAFEERLASQALASPEARAGLAAWRPTSP